MPVDMKALLARERERRRAAASGDPAGAATASSSAAATAPVVMAPRAKISLRDFDVGERAGVRGLHYVPDFISPDEERAVLAGIHAPGTESRWVRSGRRRVANYGGVPSSSEVTEPLPPFATSLLEAIASAGIVDERTAPNHVLVNEYVAPAGISPHNDGDVYAPHVAIVTLGGAALMDFWPNDGSVTADDCDDRYDDRYDEREREPTPIAQVLLRPRSLLLYTGDAYGLRHGIRHQNVDFVTDRCVNLHQVAGVEIGDEVERGRVRYSVVFVRKGRG